MSIVCMSLSRSIVPAAPETGRLCLAGSFVVSGTLLCGSVPASASDDDNDDAGASVVDICVTILSFGACLRASRPSVFLLLVI